MTAPRHDGVVTIESPFGFAETLSRLRSALDGAGLRIFAQVDQQAAARDAGLEMPPTTLIVFGNPRAGTPLMLANPRSGLDLPLKLLVTEPRPGEVQVLMNAAAYVVERHGLAPDLAQKLAPAQALVERALAAIA